MTAAGGAAVIRFALVMQTSRLPGATGMYPYPCLPGPPPQLPPKNLPRIHPNGVADYSHIPLTSPSA